MTADHCSRLATIWADGQYHNEDPHCWIFEARKDFWVEVIGRPAGSVGYVKLPRRWVMERSFAWLGRYRRNSRVYERLTGSGESMLKIGSIPRMLR